MKTRNEFFADLESGTKWNAGVAFNRTNALPLDSNSVFKSESDLADYIANGAAYPGQVVAVVTETETLFYGINQSGEYQSLGGNSNPMQFVADEDAMLALEDIEIGQQVFREDTATIWIYKGGTISNINNWIESASHNDTVWQGTENKVNFYSLTSSAYQNLTTKDTNTLYVLTDVGKIYKGTVDVTSSILYVTAMPEVNSMVASKLYVNTSTFEVAVKIGTEKIVVSPGYLTDGANWADANSSKFATIGLIKKGIEEAINAAVGTITVSTVFNSATGALTTNVSDKSDSVTLDGVAHQPTYDSTNLKLTIPVYGSDDIVVNIPKDKFVTAGTYNTDTKEIELTIEGQEEPVKIPASALVDVYTANNADNNVVISISDDNQISANVVIDQNLESNPLVAGQHGLYVDLSGVISKLSNHTEGKLVTSTADGNIAESEYSVVNSKDQAIGFSSTAVPTFSVVEDIVNTATEQNISKLQDGVEGKLVVSTLDGNVAATDLTVNDINNKLDKISSPFSDRIVISATDGTILESSYQISNAESLESDGVNLIPTSSQVASAISTELDAAKSDLEEKIEEIAVTWGTM